MEKVSDAFNPRGGLSRFVSEAVLHFVETNGRRNLGEQLKLGYQANSDESLKIAAEWLPIDEEASAALDVELPRPLRGGTASRRPPRLSRSHKAR